MQPVKQTCSLSVSGTFLFDAQFSQKNILFDLIIYMDLL